MYYLKDRKKVLFTHTDLDGVGCEVLFRIFLGEEVYRCEPDVVSDIIVSWAEDKIGNEWYIFITDLCPTLEVLELLVRKGFNVKVYDHHATNKYVENITPNAHCYPVIDPGKEDHLESGTSLFLKHLSGIMMGTGDFVRDKFLHDFVDTVRSYDTFEWKKTDNQVAKDLQTLFFILGADAFVKHYVDRYKNFNGNISVIDDMYRDIIDMKNHQEEIAMEKFLTYGTWYNVNIRGYKGALVLDIPSCNISDLATRFLVKYPEYDIMVYLLHGNTLSFRTARDDIDLGNDICKPIGGGGHPKAAGATLPDHVLTQIITSIAAAMNK